MDAKLTEGPWVLVIGKPCEIFEGTVQFSIGLSAPRDGLLFADGMREGQPDYMGISGICRPADAAAMAAAGEMLAALKMAEAWIAAAGPILLGLPSENTIRQVRAAITKATTIPAVSTAAGATDTTDGAA